MAWSSERLPKSVSHLHPTVQTRGLRSPAGWTRPTMFTVAWETQPGAAALSDKENCWKLFPVEETSQSKHLLMTSQVWQNAGWGALSEETQALPARSRPLYGTQGLSGQGLGSLCS